VAVAKPKNDTIYNYYTNKKVSVKTAPMVNDEQKIWLYDPFGNVTYTFTNSRKHGSTHTDFKYRPDGSVSETNTSIQPDG
jgi:outer membrane lipoprotein-sorting protein